jgi:hypothetical protein
MMPLSSADSRAAMSTIAPRAVLMSTASRFILLSASASIIRYVSSVSGACTLTTSLSLSSSGRESTRSTPRAISRPAAA